MKIKEKGDKKKNSVVSEKPHERFQELIKEIQMV